MSNRTRPLAAAAGALVFGVSLAAQAGDDPSKPELLTGASARTLAEPCFGCHGTDGQSQGPATPSIAGMDTDELKDRMKAFRDGKAPSTVMGRISRAYTDDEIALLAGWYAAKPFKPAQQGFDPALADQGKRLYGKLCQKCHGEPGKPSADDEEGNPFLVGQWVPYLRWSIEDFRTGHRTAPRKMKTRLDELVAREGEKGIEAVLAYFGSGK